MYILSGRLQYYIFIQPLKTLTKMFVEYCDFTFVEKKKKKKTNST